MLPDVYRVLDSSSFEQEMRNEIDTRIEWHTPKIGCCDGKKSTKKRENEIEQKKSKEKPEGFIVERFECVCMCMVTRVSQLGMS